MDIYTYNLYMEAGKLAEEDKRLFAHEQAFINQQAKATKKNGSSYYKNFEEFYGKTNKQNIRKIERTFFPEKFADEDRARIERGKQFSNEDFKFLG